MGSTRFDGGVAMTILGVLAVLGCLGSVVNAISLWTSTDVCFPDGKPRCVTTGPASGLTHGPWLYLGLALGLFLLAVCLFTLRERIRTRS